MVETHLFIGEENSFRIGRSHRYACVTANPEIMHSRSRLSKIAHPVTFPHFLLPYSRHGTKK
jgi:hypothetical protein